MTNKKTYSILKKEKHVVEVEVPSIIETKAVRIGNGAHILVPVQWIGKNVKVEVIK